MKLRILFSLSVLVIALSAVAAFYALKPFATRPPEHVGGYVASVSGYKNFRWGMTVENVRASVPTLGSYHACINLVRILQSVHHYNSGTKNLFSRYLDPTWGYADCFDGTLTCYYGRGGLMFYFLDGGLSAVVVKFYSNELSPRADLVEKYGDKHPKRYLLEGRLYEVRHWSPEPFKRLIVLNEMLSAGGYRLTSTVTYVSPGAFKTAYQIGRRKVEAEKKAELEKREKSRQKID